MFQVKREKINYKDILYQNGQNICPWIIIELLIVIRIFYKNTLKTFSGNVADLNGSDWEEKCLEKNRILIRSYPLENNPDTT